MTDHNSSPEQKFYVIHLYFFIVLEGNIDYYNISHMFNQINKNFQRKIKNIFLPIIFSICLGCSKELSH